ncbi:helix-turn-helix domain-containing protein [bacterium]|jgi:excisionase family DNA binding protein|nr:helix-turn-helix domain-containing protein [bacterium]
MGPFFENQHYVTRKRLAELLSVCPSYISKLMRYEGLPHFKIGRAVRFSVREVTEWLKKRSKP